MFNIIFYVHGYFFPASHSFLCFPGLMVSMAFFMLKKSHVLHNILLLFNVIHTKTKTLCWNMLLIITFN